MQQDVKPKRGAGRAMLALGTELNGTDEITAKTASFSLGSYAIPLLLCALQIFAQSKYSFKPLYVTPSNLSANIIRKTHVSHSSEHFGRRPA